MAGMGPTGDYDDESFINKANKKAKPAPKKTVTVTVPEKTTDDVFDEPSEEIDTSTAPTQGSSGGGFLGKLRDIFGVKKPKSTPAPVAPELPKTPEPTPSTEPPKVETPVVEEPKEEVYTADSLKWKVPSGTNKVLVNIYNSSGDKLNSYTISNFISLKSGQILEVVAE